MGATPILGLAIAAFPTDVLPLDVLQEILRGGAEKAAEAGFPIAGGHTIIDDVPKYGLAVTGVVSVDKLVRNSTAKPGDALYPDEADRQRHPDQRVSRTDATKLSAPHAAVARRGDPLDDDAQSRRREGDGRGRRRAPPPTSPATASSAICWRCAPARASARRFASSAVPVLAGRARVSRARLPSRRARCATSRPSGSRVRRCASRNPSSH